MTELQKRELVILKSFIRICEHLRLKYYLVCGSALGAMKYHGFIPWDDDIDVAMSRKDYLLFCEKAQSMLPENIFLQTYKTDNEFPCIYAKLRDSSTTFIEDGVKSLNINHGIYIDIFPLDGYPNLIKEQKKLNRKKAILKLKLSCAFSMNSNQSLKAKIAILFLRLLGYHKRTFFTAEKLEKIISKWPIESSNVWCNHGNWQKMLEYAPKEYYGSGLLVKFEDVFVYVPERYDDYLTQKYGDWRADLPEEKKISHHNVVVCDLNKSYKEYFLHSKSK